MDERNLTFRPKERSAFLLLACIAVAPATHQETTATQQGVTAPQKEPSVEDRECITAATGKLPTIGALEVKGSRALPSAQGRRDSKLYNVKVEIDVNVAGQSSTYVFNCIRSDTLTVIQPLGMR
jgi:hypothetical protein